MNSETVTSSPDQTVAFGSALAAECGPGTVFALISSLGGGKTVLAKGIALGYGVEHADTVTSPTFTLVNRYRTVHGFVYHIDLYRLHSEAEVCDIGFEEICASGEPIIIEWADRVPGLLPPETVHVLLEPTGETERRIRVSL
jgi:tRNA threonylcarbamoyladenosine biosynthesis protein TsaE